MHRASERMDYVPSHSNLMPCRSSIFRAMGGATNAVLAGAAIAALTAIAGAR